MRLDHSSKYTNFVEVNVGTLSEHIIQLTHDLEVSAEGENRKEQNFYNGNHTKSNLKHRGNNYYRYI